MQKLATVFFLFSLCLNLPVTAAVAVKCEAYVPVFVWNFYGYPIDLSIAIENLLIKKKYAIQYEPHNPNYVLNLNVDTEQRSIFRHTIAEYQFVNADGTIIRKNEFSKRCMTQLCAIYDFPKPIEKMMKDLDENLPACE